MNIRGFVFAVVLLAWLGGAPLSAESELKQQFSAWFSLNDDPPSTPRFGLRFQPTLSLAKALGAGWKLDSEFSLDMSASGLSSPTGATWTLDGSIKPYRLWLRLSSSRFEARLGLQKINFGSATIFRPLMWFDRSIPAIRCRSPTASMGCCCAIISKATPISGSGGFTATTRPRAGKRSPRPTKLRNSEAASRRPCSRAKPG